MKSVFNLLILSMVFGATVSAQAIETPVAKNGTLKVSGNKILNQHGTEPQLRGISFSWSLWGGRKYFNPAVVDWLAKDFKAGILRVAMSVQPQHGYLDEPEAQKQLVIDVVDEAIKDGVYVLIDWHDHNGYLHTAQSKAFSLSEFFDCEQVPSHTLVEKTCYFLPGKNCGNQ